MHIFRPRWQTLVALVYETAVVAECLWMLLDNEDKMGAGDSHSWSIRSVSDGPDS